MLRGFPLLAYSLFLAVAAVSANSLHAAEKPVVVQLWGLPEMDLFTGFIRAIEEYDEKHPEIEIMRGTPGGQIGLDPQKLMTSVVSGKPGDICWMDRFELSGWAARGVFTPVDELIARDGINREDFYDACLDECVYRGKTYGLPWTTDSRALWCNMDILSKYGYTTAPANWDELMAMGTKMTSRDPRGKIQTIGFAPNLGNAWLYMYGWLNGGEFASKDNLRITLSHPQIVGALEWMNQMYKQIGGRKSIEDFSSSGQMEGIAEPFISGKIAMKIDGNWMLDYVSKYNPDMNFRVVPPPAPKGRSSISWSGGHCWAIPHGSPHVEEAWKIIKHMCSTEFWIRAGELQVENNAAKARAEGIKEAFYIPQLSGSKPINEAMISRFIGKLPPRIQEAFVTHVALLEVCRFRPVVPVGRLLWEEHVRATEQVLWGELPAAAALRAAERRVQAEYDRFLKPNPAPIYSIGKVFAFAFAAVLALGAFIWYRAFKKWHWTPRVVGEARAGILFASPWLLGFLIFLLGPMLASFIMALSEYDVMNPARWIGLGNFRKLLGSTTDVDGHVIPSSPHFWKALSNTSLAAIMGVPLGIIVSLGMALLVNKEVKGVRIYRTLFYLPVIVPAVCTAVLWMWLLNSETGLTGALLNPLLVKLGLKPISFFGDERFATLAVVLMVTWGAGGSMIIWLAGLKSIPRSYYEAAAIDGAGPIGTFFRVTLPLLSPYIFFNVIMGIIGWLQIFTQPYVLILPPSYGVNDSMLYYVMYLFIQGFQYFNMGLACAMAWILFTIVALLTLVQFKLAPRWVHYEH